MAAYVRALGSMLAEARGSGLLDACATAYIGGGTPSMLGARELGNLLCEVARLAPLRELSFEANPESLDDELLAIAADDGATRVSIGVQSFDDHELDALGRIHSAELARRRVEAAVASGMRVSVDLMCGIPYQTPESWTRSLDAALELGVGHVSCYPLMIEEGTELERLCDEGRLPWPDDDAEADFMEAAERLLSSAGFARYEVASYARVGEQCAHNLAYWTGVPYLGLGVAASSMLSAEGYDLLRAIAGNLPPVPGDIARVRVTCTSDAPSIARVQSLSRLSWDVEGLTQPQALAEDLMLAARMARGIPRSLVARSREALGPERVDDVLSGLVARGLLARSSDGSLTPTHRGWLLGNELYGELWGLAPSMGTMTMSVAAPD